MNRPRPSYRHTIRLFLLIGIVLAGALVVRHLLVPASFGELGHYRAAAIAEAGEPAPRHVGAAACADCHDVVAALRAKDAHASVQCETCHGPGAAHVEAGGDAPIRRPDGREACLVCHRLLLARPGDFAQVVPAAHYEFVGVADPETPCTACHDPHEPLYMDRDLRTARLHPLIHRCRDCHPGRPDETLPRPPDHPAIFRCDYCHGAIAADFADRPHRRMRCTACHVFIREGESAGRIVRDADPRFCLLCHRAAPFRGATAAPSIEWPAHLDDVADPGRRDLRCIDCHQDRIHRTGALGVGAADREGTHG